MLGGERLFGLWIFRGQLGYSNAAIHRLLAIFDRNAAYGEGKSRINVFHISEDISAVPFN